MTEVSKKLKVNLKNIRRPIIGILPNKKITKDVIGIEIPLRVFSRIKYDCNVYHARNNKEIVITNEQQFLELLETCNVHKDTVTFEKVEKPVSIPFNKEVKPVTTEILEADNNTINANEDHIKNDQEEHITTNIPDSTESKTERVFEQIEEVEESITTKDNNTVGVRKNNKKNRR